jgi:hypothetical protein
MRYPQLVVFEHDGRLAWLLKDICAAQRWSLKETRQVEACLRLLRAGGPAILITRIAGKMNKEETAEETEREQKDLERSFVLIDRAHWLRPDTAIVAVSELENATLTALAWDLGASYVLAPPQLVGALPELIGHMMTAMVRALPDQAPSGKEHA